MTGAAAREVRAGEDRARVLRGAGLRRTQPRLAVLAFMERASAPVTHAEVAEALAPTGIDRATVYRNLTELVRAGILTRGDFGDRVWRFAVAERGERGAPKEHEPSDHPHFLCTSCGSVICLPSKAVRLDLSGVGKVRKRQPLAIRVTGVCSACA